MRPVTRYQILRGDFGSVEQPVRPPWARPEATFVRLCDRCGRCASACEQGLIVTGRFGLPGMDFRNGGCTFCGGCVEACSRGALELNSDGPWNVHARIGAGCIAVQGVVCRSCGEDCEEDAIRFVQVARGAPIPVVSRQRCTGCGGCISACPVRMIDLGPSE